MIKRHQKREKEWLPVSEEMILKGIKNSIEEGTGVKP